MRTRRILAILVTSFALSTSVHAECQTADRTSSLEEIVGRVHEEQVRYIFVGERHGVGPVKKFAVDLSNELIESGLDVGLYVEGFRTDCPPQDESCWSLARAFNLLAFRTLVDESNAPVHPIDSPLGNERTTRMAAAIAEGWEEVRVVLVGNSHVLHAGDGEAELWIYGGGLKFPDPGDVVEVFPRQEVLTLGLETSREIAPPYALQASGCGVDYVVTTQDTGQYWGRLADAIPAEMPDETATPDVPDTVASEAEGADVAVTSSG